MNSIVWAGNTGTPTDSCHCGLTPRGITIGAYQQSDSYDALDCLINGSLKIETYGSFPASGAVTLGNVPNQYASYDVTGNMTSGHGCDAAQSGAIMTYDNEGRLAIWVAPNGTVASDQYLYDNSGQRVLQRASNTVGSTTMTSDTISFDGFTDVTITGGTTSTTKYYSPGGQKVAMRQDGTFSYLMPDFLGATASRCEPMARYRRCNSSLPLAQRGTVTARCSRPSTSRASVSMPRRACSTITRGIMMLRVVVVFTSADT
ncbi:hypothetical protein KDK_69890 [Dictyobacter kobayashii]|uniref:Uncharacterized protein n=1 Tax=Dictyobacter kobayashii TaxID=2014872 RepID=A0A402AVS7_9CHLR|nr:hypothetical protein [Dictyobacter kobayashii]GCE23189.1 hypothetical protein KDK_69890 [Dictyobacter kobayashii]